MRRRFASSDPRARADGRRRRRVMALVGAVVGISGAAPAAGAQQPFRAARGLDPTAAVRVFSMAGSITVTGWERDSIDVVGTVGTGLTPRSGGTRSGYKLSTYDGMQDTGSPSHLAIRVPRRAQLWIKTTTADVVVRAVDGSVDVYTIEGDIDVAGAPDELTAETMRGAVSVSGKPGWVRAKSGTGPVMFDGTARDLALSTVSGRIESSSRFERGRFESVRGDIELAGPLAGAATAEIDNHAGAVTLRLGPATSAAFMVFSVTGRITNELSDARARPSSGTGSELAFLAGGGAARVTVRTFAGAVTLRPR